MPLWDKVRQELDRAGRVAQDAIDEGKVRLDAFRARQLADRAAQALGYAVYRARKAGGDIDAESYDRLSATLASHEAAAAALEDRLEAQRRRGGHSGSDAGASTSAGSTAGATAADAAAVDDIGISPTPPGPAGDAEGPHGAGRPSTDVPPI